MQTHRVNQIMNRSQGNWRPDPLLLCLSGARLLALLIFLLTFLTIFLVFSPMSAYADSPLDQISWISPDEKTTYSVAWGDYDGDGDLDLAVGNYGQVNQLYRNEGGHFRSLRPRL